MTCGFCSRKKVFTRFSSPSVVTLAFAGSCACAGASSASRVGVARLAIERELQVARHVFVARIDARVVRKLGELRGERLVERIGMAATVTVARARVEQRIAAEETALRRMRQQADVRHGVARRIQAFQLDRAPHADHVALAETPIDAADAARRARMRQHLRARRADQSSLPPVWS